MKFRNEYIAKPGKFILSPEESVTLIGSCFSTNIGGLMRQGLWNAVVNPTGTLFNPCSIANHLNSAIQCKRKLPFEVLTEQHLDRWISLDFQEINTSNREDCEAQCKDKVACLAEALNHSQALILTWGTAWVYEDLKRDRNRVVANCHKLPGDRFRRSRLSVEQIVNSWEATLKEIRNEWPELKILLTVSPVRHLRDSFYDNSVSKATLLLAVDELLNRRLIDDYFPAYEIFIDDLRDYRWVAEDLAHPTAAASEYIFQKFIETYLDTDGISLLQEGKKINSRLNHRLLYPDSIESKQFIEKTASLTRLFAAEHPGMLSPTGD